jgi:glutamate transport system permease protein
VSAVPALRAVGTAYVTVFRNTPLLVVFLLVYYGLPELDIRPPQFWKAAIALSLYTSAFICEAVRSGVNAVPPGQAEAARSVGMGFGQTLRLVVLPQAFRAVIPPIANVLIALAKNTSLVAGFGIADATFRMRGLINNHPGDVYVIFGGIALGYVLIVAVISLAARGLERTASAAR